MRKKDAQVLWMVGQMITEVNQRIMERILDPSLEPETALLCACVWGMVGWAEVLPTVLGAVQEHVESTHSTRHLEGMDREIIDLFLRRWEAMRAEGAPPIPDVFLRAFERKDDEHDNDH